MNTRKVSKNIRNKLSDWFSSIDDETLVDDLKEFVFVSGGSINSLLTSDKVSDYDVYLSDYHTANRLTEYYINLYNKANDTSICVDDPDGINSYDRVNIGNLDGSLSNESGKNPENKKYFPTFITNNAITLTDDIQIIVRFVGNPEEVHKNFDFVHCTNYYDYCSDSLELNVDALASLITKELVYRGSKYPVASLYRTRKFIERGFFISAGTLTKISYDISRLDLSDVNVLKDQIMGVDTITMLAVLNELKDRGFDDNGKTSVNSDLLFEIIDNHF